MQAHSNDAGTIAVVNFSNNIHQLSANIQYLHISMPRCYTDTNNKKHSRQLHADIYTPLDQKLLKCLYCPQHRDMKHIRRLVGWLEFNGAFNTIQSNRAFKVELYYKY